MKKYQALINGTNFYIEINGVLDKWGYYTNRYVEATNIEDAELMVMDLIRGIQDLRDGIRNNEDDMPRMHAEEIYEIESFEAVDSIEEGLAWYKENESPEEAACEDVHEVHITSLGNGQ